MITIRKTSKSVTYYGTPREAGLLSVTVVKYLKSRIKYVIVYNGGIKLFSGQLPNDKAKALLWMNCAADGEVLPKWL